MPPTDPRAAFDDDFTGSGLDLDRWVPAYLPAWSSLAASAAAYEVRGSALHLSVPPDHPVWCAGDHEPRLRVSAVQSGNASGPVGSTRGQQPYRPGLRVREEQETFWGWTPWRGRVEVRASMHLGRRSMAAAWLVGLEDEPERSAEICLVEVFGDAVDPGSSAAVGAGLHPFRDPHVREDFGAARLPIDVALPHTYALDWTREEAVLSVDGTLVRRCAAPPDYPMQLILAVFDFPDNGPDDGVVPELVVDRVRGGPA